MEPLRGGSLFSGIGGAELAMPWVDWRWCAEIDPFASAVLAHRYPDVPNLGDVNRINSDAVEPVDLIVFGSPCQSFSIAGKRLGLDDPRGNMALIGLRVVGRIRPRWMVWENVPGVLSSDGGRNFGAFLGLLGELGYGFAYRVLDAQHFGVPQRRRRVFVVGCLGDWRPAAAVLFEPESLRGDSPPRREAGQGIARPVASCPEGGSGYRCDADTADNLIAFSAKYAGAVSAEPGAQQQTYIAHSLRADGFDASEDGTGRGTPLVAQAVTADYRHVRPEKDRGTCVREGMSVRRLLPVECERLQGYPDGFTAVTYRGKPAADGNRYRALGNSYAIPVVKWIGERIKMFHVEREKPPSE